MMKLDLKRKADFSILKFDTSHENRQFIFM